MKKLGADGVAAQPGRTDAHTPGRWFYVGEYADRVRRWLLDLPPQFVENIAYRNAAAQQQLGELYDAAESNCRWRFSA